MNYHNSIYRNLELIETGTGGHLPSSIEMIFRIRIEIKWVLEKLLEMNVGIEEHLQSVKELDKRMTDVFKSIKLGDEKILDFLNEKFKAYLASYLGRDLNFTEFPKFEDEFDNLLVIRSNLEILKEYLSEKGKDTSEADRKVSEKDDFLRKWAEKAAELYWDSYDKLHYPKKYWWRHIREEFIKSK